MGEGGLLAPTAALSRQFTRPPELDLDALERGRRQLQRRGFFIGGVGLLVEPRLLMEVLERPRVFPLPSAPASCRGVLNLRGTLVPVFDIRPRLGGSEALPRWVLVMGRALEAAGFYIDALPVQVAANEETRLERLPKAPPFLQPVIAAAYYVNQQVFFELDHRALLRSLGQGG
jgi:twitching motility protein PilI